jgi:hypothetical protein
MSKPSLTFRLAHLFRKWPVQPLIEAIQSGDTQAVVEALQTMPSRAINHGFAHEYWEEGDGIYQPDYIVNIFHTPLEHAMINHCNPHIIAVLLDAGAAITPFSLRSMANAEYLKEKGPLADNAEEEFVQILQLFSAFNAPWHTKINDTKDAPSFAKRLAENIDQELYQQADIPDLIFEKNLTLAQDILQRQKGQSPLKLSSDKRPNF